MDSIAPVNEISTANLDVIRSTKRIAGLDVARGLAIIGMIGVHVLDSEPFPGLPWLPGGLDQAFAGRSQMLFAVLAGVSIALMTGGMKPVQSVGLVQWRLRIIVRGLLLFGLGGVLSSFPYSNIGVILEYLGVSMILIVPLLSIRFERLIWIIPLAIALSMFGVAFGQNLIYRQELGTASTIHRLLISGQYPSLRWTAFMLIGLAIGRLAITDYGIQLRLLSVGGFVALSAFVGEWTLTKIWADSGVPLSTEISRFDLSRVLFQTGSARTIFDYVENSGVAVVVIALCLMLPSSMRFLYAPVAAAGSMALTIYTVHVISMNWIRPRIALSNQFEIYIATVAIVLTASLIWQSQFGQGPLERIVRFVSDRAARIS